MKNDFAHLRSQKSYLNQKFKRIIFLKYFLGEKIEFFIFCVKKKHSRSQANSHQILPL